jgi:uncharacterized membrane protein required for colicin V production
MVDLILVGVMFIFIANNYRKGFLKSIYGLVSIATGLIVAYWLGGPAQSFLINLGFDQSIYFYLHNNLFNENPVFDLVITSQNMIDSLTQGLTAINLPSTIIQPISSFLNTLNVPLGEALSTALTQFILLIVSFLLIYILVRIITRILFNQLIRKVESTTALDQANKILGGIFGLFKGFVFVSLVILLLIALSFVNPQMNTWLVNEFRLNSEQFNIGKYLYELLTQWMSSIL